MRTLCVSAPVMVTFAPTTAAPLGSVTLPEIRPKMVWPQVVGTCKIIAASKKKAARLICGRMAADILRKRVLIPEPLIDGRFAISCKPLRRVLFYYMSQALSPCKWGISWDGLQPALV